MPSRSLRRPRVPSQLGQLGQLGLLGSTGSTLLGGALLCCALLGCAPADDAGPGAASSGSSPAAPAPARADSCAYASDGVCDEPWACKAGTDGTDCAAACASGALAASHVACVVRSRPPAPEATPASHGSGGTSGPVGTWDGSLSARGAQAGTTVDRYFRVHVPDRYDPRVPTPVVYQLGGFTVGMYVLDGYTELDRTADLNDFIVVYLAPLFRDFGGNIGWVNSWHVYTNEWSPPTWAENPDVDFVRKLTAKLKSLYNVDRTRVFATGHSRGAALSIILAFVAPELVAGFGSEAGFIDVNKFDTVMRAYKGRRMPGVLLHGTSDADVPVGSSDEIADTLRAGGWEEGTHFVYHRLPGVPHQWQPAYNEDVYRFLQAHPMPIAEALP